MDGRGRLLWRGRSRRGPAQCPLSVDCLPRSGLVQDYFCINEKSLFASKHDFRSWHEADMPITLSNVRFVPKADAAPLERMRP